LAEFIVHEYPATGIKKSRVLLLIGASRKKKMSGTCEKLSTRRLSDNPLSRQPASHFIFFKLLDAFLPVFFDFLLYLNKITVLLQCIRCRFDGDSNHDTGEDNAAKGYQHRNTPGYFFHRHKITIANGERRDE
jgi:hypothetical protein